MKVKTELNVSDNKVTNVATPTTDKDAATKKYVDDNITTPANIVNPLLLIGA